MCVGDREMAEAEFDNFAADYQRLHEESIGFSGCNASYFAAYKVRRAAEMHRRFGAPPSILDFGGGTGTSIPHFRRELPRVDLICADVSRKSLAAAASEFGDTANYLPIEDETLALATESVGMCFASCVFHHIPPVRHGHWLGELRRVTQSGGLLVIFEHNPFNPLTRHAVNNCVFDRDAILLKAQTLRRQVKRAGWHILETRYHVFFPEFLRGLRPLESYLGWLPLGGQYSLVARR
jgi:ubiquinone/menaquinone biosynthesis C-methylase UbiE